MDRIDRLWASLIEVAAEVGKLKLDSNYWKDRCKSVERLLALVWTISIFKSLVILYLVLRLSGYLGGYLGG